MTTLRKNGFRFLKCVTFIVIKQNFLILENLMECGGNNFITLFFSLSLPETTHLAKQK